MNATNTMNLDHEITLKSGNQPRLTAWTLVWAGLWTGVLLCGFVLLMR